MTLVSTDEIDDDTLRLTLNRPEKLNAMNKALLSEITEEIRSADGYSILVINAAGDAFTAGADLAEIRDEGEDASLFQDMTRAVYNFDGIVIGALHGWVIGGGFEWTLSFDLRYGAEDATFKMTESEVGLPVSNASTMLLPLIVGDGRARELIYTARELDAEEAAEWGLLNGVVERGELDDHVRSVAADLAENKSDLGLRLNKRGLNNVFPVDQILECETLLADFADAADEEVEW